MWICLQLLYLLKQPCRWQNSAKTGSMNILLNILKYTVVSDSFIKLTYNISSDIYRYVHLTILCTNIISD